MKLRRALMLIILALFAGSASAQDIHFSQYYASPLNLNPAYTGAFNGLFRGAVNYRNQWFTIPSANAFTFVTYSGSFDMPILQRRLREDQLGVGFVVYNDVSGDGGLTTLTAMAGAAYHKMLDDFQRFSISLGVHVGIINKRINFTKLTFESQFVPDFGFIGPLTEPIDRTSLIMPDFVIGVLFRGRFADNVNAYIGASAAHVHKPKEYFLNTINSRQNRLDPRYNAHGGVDISIGKYITLTPGFLYKVQSTNQQINAGLAFGYELNDQNAIYVGSWFRILDKDALIAMAAYEFNGLRLGLSYDVNLSDLNPASNGHGAVEVSLIYIHNQEPIQKMSPVKFCPKF